MATTNTKKTKETVDNMTARDRLWDSLDYSYGKKREESNTAYDKAIAQQDRAMLGRGMQRSSYNAQTMANMRNEQVKASNDIYDAQIADYENRIADIERQEKQDEQWERQFAEGQRQFNENLAYQKERATVSDTQWQKNYDEQLRQFNENMAYQKERAGVSDAQWQKEYDRALDQFNQNMALQREQFTEQKTQNAWNREFQTSEAAREQANTEWSQAFQKEQFAAQQDQWKQQFNYQQKSDDQKIAASYAMQIIQQGGNPSDDLLARAGLSRNDANAMKAQVAAVGGGGRGPGKGDNEVELTGTPISVTEFLNGLGNTSGLAGNLFSNNGNTSTQNTSQATSKATEDEKIKYRSTTGGSANSRSSIFNRAIK